MKEQYLAGVHSKDKTSFIRMERESQAEARAGRGEYLTYLQDLLNMPPYIRDAFLEEYHLPGIKSKTYDNWNVPKDYKLDQHTIFRTILRSGTFLGVGYVPYGPEIVEKKNNFGIIENEKGLSCSINHKVSQNINLVFGRDSSIVVEIKKRWEKPFELERVYTDEEIRNFPINNAPVEISMDPTIPYTLERAEIDIIDNQLR